MGDSATVHQFVPCLLPMDAVGNHTLGVHAALDRAGVANDIWAISIHHTLDGYGRPYPEFTDARRGAGKRGVALYEACSVAGNLVDFFLALRDPKVIYYHNLTPPEFFDPYDAEVARGLREARREVARVAAASRVGIAASEYNAEELRRLGVSDVSVIPPYLAPRRPANPDPDRLEELRAEKRGTDLLFVGRLAPNKGHGHLIRTVAALRSGGDPHARLFLVGGEGPRPYMRALRRLADQLAPDAVFFTGPVSDAVRDAHYAGADLFVSMSEHEGFGIPLLEAMRAGLPVIALDRAAVAETLDGAGVLVRSTDPRTLAEIVTQVTSDPALMAAVRRRQHERARELEEFPRDRLLLEAIQRAAG